MDINIFASLRLRFFHSQAAISSHMIGNVLTRVASIGMSLIIFRMSYYYFDDMASRGIWITLLSTLGWCSYLDFGIGNGIKNSITRFHAVKLYDRCRSEIATAYFMSMFLYALATLGILLFLYGTLSGSLFSQQQSGSIKNAMIILLIGNMLYIWLSLANSVLQSLQLSVIPGVLSLGAQIGFCVFLLLTRSFTKGNFIAISVGYVAPLILIMLIANVWLFKYKFPELYFNLADVQSQTFFNILKTGSLFWGMQIMYMLLYATGPYLLTMFYGPSESVVYQILQRYFGAIHSVFIAILVPLWPAIARAKSEKEYGQIYKYLSMMRYGTIAVALIYIVIALMSRFVLKVWIGDASLHVTNLQITLTCIFYITMFWCGTIGVVLNAFDLLRVQFLAVTAGVFIYIMAFIVGCWFKLNGTSIIIASSILGLFPLSVVGPGWITDALRSFHKSEIEVKDLSSS